MTRRLEFAGAGSYYYDWVDTVENRVLRAWRVGVGDTYRVREFPGHDVLFTMERYSDIGSWFVNGRCTGRKSLCDAIEGVL